jgi:hypothetical protein
MSPTQYWNNNVSIKSRFIALAPADGTFSQTGGTVTWTTALNGYTDVMCSIPVEGDKTASATAGISMQLKHLLTLIQVNVVAKSGEGAGPADFFGQVTGIELVNKKTGFVVTLPATTATITGGATPTAPLATAAATGTPANLPLIRTKTGDAITNVTIPSTGTATFGYALIAPVLAAGQISLLVKTASNTAGSTVNTASQIFAAGNSYTITLEFSAATGGVTVKDVSAGSDIAGWGPGSVSGGNVAVTQ